MIKNNRLVREYYDISKSIQETTRSMVFRYASVRHLINELGKNITDIIKKDYPKFKPTKMDSMQRLYHYLKQFDYIEFTYEDFCSGLLDVQNKVVDDELKRLGKTVEDTRSST